MQRLVLLVAFAFATAVWAQDSAQESAEDEAPVAETVAETESESESESESEELLTEEELEELDIGSQQDHTEEDEDVFKPTDAVSYQQSVVFPVDI